MTVWESLPICFYGLCSFCCCLVGVEVRVWGGVHQNIKDDFFMSLMTPNPITKFQLVLHFKYSNLCYGDVSFLTIGIYTCLQMPLMNCMLIYLGEEKESLAQHKRLRSFSLSCCSWHSGAVARLLHFVRKSGKLQDLGCELWILLSAY